MESLKLFMLNHPRMVLALACILLILLFFAASFSIDYLVDTYGDEIPTPTYVILIVVMLMIQFGFIWRDARNRQRRNNSNGNGNGNGGGSLIPPDDDGTLTTLSTADTDGRMT